MIHWSRLVFLVSALCAFQALWVSGAQAERRLALIVGIDQYDNLDNLQKAGNDARSVSTTLEQLGFVVTTLIDVDRRKLGRSIASFSSSIQPGDEVVFFFAGHGVELDGRNYLLPADVPKAEPGEEEFLKLESIAANDLSPLFKSQGARVSVLIIDACRENPFPKQGTRSLGGRAVWRAWTRPKAHLFCFLRPADSLHSTGCQMRIRTRIRSLHVRCCLD
ncbi:MAG: caspase family protein [Pseudomonadota bacterium]